MKILQALSALLGVNLLGNEGFADSEVSPGG